MLDQSLAVKMSLEGFLAERSETRSTAGFSSEPPPGPPYLQEELVSWPEAPVRGVGRYGGERSFKDLKLMQNSSNTSSH